MKLSLKTLAFLPFATVLFLTACQKENVNNVNNNLNPPIAIAGPSQTINTTTATLSGSGTTENGHITGYLWSLISGPNLPAILTPSASTTVVSGLTAGTYLLQFAVIDSMGLTGIDTTSITVSQLTIQTLILQPANNTQELNFAYHNGEASAHQIDLDAGAWTWNGIALDIRGALGFDMSSIPSGSTILSAKLSLYSNLTPINGDLVNANSGTNDFYIRRITSSWSPLTSTWLTQPASSTTDEVLMPQSTAPFQDLIDIDVTTMVSNMWPSANYGFIMQLVNETPYNIRQFASSVHPNAALHPKLVITYQ